MHALFENVSLQLQLLLLILYYCTSQSKPRPLPTPGTCGALVGLYHRIGSSLSPQYVGDLLVFLFLS